MMIKLIQRIVLFIFCTWLVACSSASVSKKNSLVIEKPTHKILVVKEEWHTSLVLEAPALLQAMPELSGELTGQPFARVGWGDGDFFSGKNKSNLSAARALFVSSYSAMQVLSYDVWPDKDFEESQKVDLMIDESAYRQLILFIKNSFALNDARHLIPLKSYDENTGVFFEARPHYSLFNNCNSWTGDALRAAGISVGVHLTPSTLMNDLKKIQRLRSNYSS